MIVGGISVYAGHHLPVNDCNEKRCLPYSIVGAGFMPAHLRLVRPRAGMNPAPYRLFVMAHEAGINSSYPSL